MEYDDTRGPDRVEKPRKGYDALVLYAGADRVTINGERVQLYGHKPCGQVVYDIDTHNLICKWAQK